MASFASKIYLLGLSVPWDFFRSVDFQLIHDGLYTPYNCQMTCRYSLTASTGNGHWLTNHTEQWRIQDFGSGGQISEIQANAANTF